MVLGNEKKVNVLGVPFNDVPEEVFEAVVLREAQSTEAKKVVFLDFKAFMRERRRLKKGKPSFLTQSDLVFTTSSTLAKAAKKLYGAQHIRFYPFYFVVRVLGVLEQRNYSAYFLGGNTDEINELVSHIRSTFRGVKVVGKYRGNYPKEQESAILTGMKKAGAHFVLVGSRIKHPEKWVISAADSLKGLVVVSPEAFNVMAGKLKLKSADDWSRKKTHSVLWFLLPWNALTAVAYLKFALLVAIEKKKLKKGNGRSV